MNSLKPLYKVVVILILQMRKLTSILMSHTNHWFQAVWLQSLFVVILVGSVLGTEPSKHSLYY
jgi:hypothetical protein